MAQHRNTPVADRRRRTAAIVLLLIVDVGFVAWGAAAAIAPNRLLGPGGTPILTAGYEGFTKGSWQELASTLPMAAEYMEVLYRMYGIFNVVFGLLAIAIVLNAFRRAEPWAWWTLLAGNTITLTSAMRYDWMVNAIGPFEVTEYIGLAMVVSALALTTPFGRRHRSPQSGLASTRLA